MGALSPCGLKETKWQRHYSDCNASPFAPAIGVCYRECAFKKAHAYSLALKSMLNAPVPRRGKRLALRLRWRWTCRHCASRRARRFALFPAGTLSSLWWSGLRLLRQEKTCRRCRASTKQKRGEHWPRCRLAPRGLPKTRRLQRRRQRPGELHKQAATTSWPHWNSPWNKCVLHQCTLKGSKFCQHRRGKRQGILPCWQWL